MRYISAKIILTVVISSLLVLGVVNAQTVPFTFAGTSPVALQMDSYGTLSSLGTFGTGTLSLSNAGTRMFWYPGKAAFRAGYVSGTQWNDGNIGSYSTAFGSNNTASASNSSAFGDNNTVGGNYSMAVGQGNTIQNQYELAQGVGNLVFGYDAVAFGGGNWAGASYSTAIGFYNFALGNYSTDIGSNNGTTGTFSMVVGTGLSVSSENCLAIGQYNADNGSSTSWVPTDPIFEIGNGTSSSSTSNSVVIYKNGSAKFSGAISIPQSGDIPMYTGN